MTKHYISDKPAASFSFSAEADTFYPAQQFLPLWSDPSLIAAQLGAVAVNINLCMYAMVQIAQERQSRWVASEAFQVTPAFPPGTFYKMQPPDCSHTAAKPEVKTIAILRSSRQDLPKMPFALMPTWMGTRA